MTVVNHHADDPGTIAWRLHQLEGTVVALEQKVDRLTWALTMASVSFAVAAASALLLYLSGAHA